MTALLQDLLNQLDSLGLARVHDGLHNIHRVRGEDSLLLDDAVEHELNRDSAGNSDQLGHRRGTRVGSDGGAVVEEGGSVGLL